MKLSQIKKHLETAEAVNFELPDGTMVPENFHVTEVGIVARHFIDCGVTVRKEKTANFQLWDASDYGHRLKPGKLLKIIGLSEKVLAMEDLDIEVEFQSETIGKYDLGFDGKNFLLLAKHTNCLARENCGVAENNADSPMKDSSCCAPGGGCC